VFVLWRQGHSHTLQGTKSATPDAPRLRELYRTCWRCKYWISDVIVFDILGSLCCSVMCKDFYALQLTALAPPDAPQLRELYRTCWRFKY
jgi:hypothetical protein